MEAFIDCNVTKCDFYDADYLENCGYEYHIGAPRPCKVGDRCDFNPCRHPGTIEDGRSKNKGVISKEKQAEKDARMNLYLSGMTDAEIAAAQGRAVSTICAWRKDLQLPPNIADKVIDAIVDNEVEIIPCEPMAVEFATTQKEPLTAAHLMDILGALPPETPIYCMECGIQFWYGHEEVKYTVEGELVSESKFYLGGE